MYKLFADVFSLWTDPFIPKARRIASWHETHHLKQTLSWKVGLEDVKYFIFIGQNKHRWRPNPFLLPSCLKPAANRGRDKVKRQQIKDPKLIPYRIISASAKNLGPNNPHLPNEASLDGKTRDSSPERGEPQLHETMAAFNPPPRHLLMSWKLKLLLKCSSTWHLTGGWWLSFKEAAQSWHISHIGSGNTLS